MSTYGYLYIPTGACVHFIDQCPDLAELQEYVQEARSKNVRLVYLDCADFVWRLWDIPNRIGSAAGAAHPPYDVDSEPHWLRWWDDLLSLGHSVNANGLAIILDNAHVAFEADRKFMTNLLESFLHGMKSWIYSEKPYHLHFQMVSCSAVSVAFGSASNKSDA